MPTVVDPETGVEYVTPDQPQAPPPQTRSQRQSEADLLRILNRFAGPAPERPRIPPFLHFDLQTKDPWRLRAAKAQADLVGEQQSKFNTEMQNRVLALDAIRRMQGAAPAEPQESPVQSFIRASQEQAVMKQAGAAPVAPADIREIAAQQPGQNPLDVLQAVQSALAERGQSQAAAREQAGLPTAPPPNFETLVRGVPGLGEQLAQRLTEVTSPGFRAKTVRARERLFGKGRQSERLDEILRSLEAEGARGVFEIR